MISECNEREYSSDKNKSSVNQVLKFVYIPTGIYICKLNSGNTKTSCELYSNLTIKITGRSTVTLL